MFKRFSVGLGALALATVAMVACNGASQYACASPLDASTVVFVPARGGGGGGGGGGGHAPSGGTHGGSSGGSTGRSGGSPSKAPSNPGVHANQAPSNSGVHAGSPSSPARVSSYPSGLSSVGSGRASYSTGGHTYIFVGHPASYWHAWSYRPGDPENYNPMNPYNISNRYSPFYGRRLVYSNGVCQ